MSSEMNRIVQFGPFVLEPDQARLTRAGSSVSLPPKVFDLLCYLVSNAGRLIEKDELLKALWPDSFVEEANLTVSVAALRKALGAQEDGTPWIETVPKRGYRFAGEVREVHPPEVVQAEIRPPDVKKRSGKYWAMAAVVVVGAGILIYGLGRRETVIKRSPQSIAVLPFVEITGEPSIGLGMADALITRLSAIAELTVRPVSTIRKYDGTQIDPIAAGKELKVNTVVSGTVQQIDKRLRVSVQLVRIQDGQTLWSDKFDEFFTNIFAVQDAISEKLAHTLALRLSSEEQDRMMRRFTESAEAFRLYEIGKYKSYAAPREALTYFDAALKEDPRYVLPYVDEAVLYWNLAGGGGAHYRERMPLARKAAQKALELAPDFADAHAALAGILHYADRDYAGARREIDLALKLNPQSARAHDKLAEIRAIQGDLEGALSEERIAAGLDPFNGDLAFNVGFLLYLSHRYEEAIQTVEEFERRDPRALDSYMQNIHYHCYLKTSRVEKAIATIEERRRKESPSYATDLELAYAYALAGRREEARKLLQTGPPNERSYERGIVHMALGEIDAAFERLNRAVDEHSIWTEWFKVDPALDSLRGDLRFPKLLARMGLPQ